jgi:hypothetical protein
MYTGHYIHEGRSIYGPAGYTEFYVHKGQHIFGPSEVLPWTV